MCHSVPRPRSFGSNRSPPNRSRKRSASATALLLRRGLHYRNGSASSTKLPCVLSLIAGSGPRPFANARSSMRRPCSRPGRPNLPSTQPRSHRRRKKLPHQLYQLCLRLRHVRLPMLSAASTHSKKIAGYADAEGTHADRHSARSRRFRVIEGGRQALKNILQCVAGP
jgi:hypothetical protein